MEGWKLVNGGISSRRWNFGLVEGGGWYYSVARCYK